MFLVGVLIRRPGRKSKHMKLTSAVNAISLTPGKKDLNIRRNTSPNNCTVQTADNTALLFSGLVAALVSRD